MRWTQLLGPNWGEMTNIGDMSVYAGVEGGHQAGDRDARDAVPGDAEAQLPP